MRYLFYFLIVSILFASCKPADKELSAQEIIDKSIQAAQLNKVADANISFKFRDRIYTASRKGGMYSLKRITNLENDVITDVLSNEGFQRLVNDEPTQVADSMALKYSESVNSVHYFSVLPYGLNDGAVKKKLLSSSTIKGKEYYKVKVSFNQDGGGVDFEDVFIYWFDKENFELDYLAYSFQVNGGGMRFREVRKEHLIEGIRFVDYNNYGPTRKETRLEELDKAYENGTLKKLSEINLENVEVSLY